jgi:adenylate cyclase
VLRTVGLLQLKGKSMPADVFTALGERSELGEVEWLAHYEEAVARYRRRDFPGAVERFETAAAAQPDDWLIQQYLRISKECAASPPAPEWNGVWVLEEK